jgi:hypothetical protein
MTIETGTLLSLWPNLEDIPACNEGMKLARVFLEAAGVCVNTLGRGRTSGTRAALLTSYNWMEAHGNRCEKCNQAQ